MKSNNKILELINKNASVNEICNITGLSHKQLFYRMNMIKIKGYDFTKKYYYNGEIVYDLAKSLNNDNDNEATIITSKKDKVFKAILISDLHFGNVNERPDLLYKTYEMCIKDGINIIINTGDLIDGPIGCGDVHNKITLDIERQIETMLKNYPFDKNILNFICLGNHDLYCLKTNGINLKNILDNKRHDLISLGYGYGKINVKNDKIYVTHPTTGIIDSDNEAKNKFILTGHSHLYKYIPGGSNNHIYVPTLSDLPFTDSGGTYKHFPSILKIDLEFINGVFNVGNIEQLVYINNDFYKISESQIEFKGRNQASKKVLNEEERKEFKEVEEQKVKVLKPNNKERLSQSEKFKMKYNK